MNATDATGQASVAPASTLLGRMLNMVSAPADVLDEVVSGPPNLANWRGPTLLVCLTALVGLHVRLDLEYLGGAWPLAGSLVAMGLSLAGSLWSAFVLWFLGRILLGGRFGYLKALEVAGLASCVMALGNVITALLVLAEGNFGAQPNLAYLAADLPLGSTMRQVLGLLNPFHLWSEVLLALGLSKLAGVSFKEAAFWVFGFWFVLRIVLVLVSSP